ncbi:MAG: phosphatidate cytidylyltransferase [Chitinispirillales bacterium]|jgi:phosphatidate cytidylyltransferase|nr:phosphatidate cytidylyltransferase [Chitinispirillales bacterium]
MNEENKEKRTLKNIGKRLLFVAWAMPATLLIIYFKVNIVSAIFGDKFDDTIKPIYPATILTFILIAFAAKEYFSMLKIKFKKNWFWIGYVWIAVTMCDSINCVPLLNFSHSLYLLLILTAFEVFFVGKGKQRWQRASLFFIGVIFLYLAGNSLLQYLEPAFVNIWYFPIDNQYIASNLGLITVLCAIFFCDSAAYFVGSLLGKHHFSDISPKKTIEGCIGGFLLSVIVMTTVFGFFRNPNEPVWLGILLGVTIGIFAQVGDLFVSLTKRYFAVKDSSDLIPGHGGILDRFDSVFFVSPFIHIIITLVHKLGA